MFHNKVALKANKNTVAVKATKELIEELRDGAAEFKRVPLSKYGVDIDIVSAHSVYSDHVKVRADYGDFVVVDENSILVFTPVPGGYYLMDILAEELDTLLYTLELLDDGSENNFIVNEHNIQALNTVFGFDYTLEANIFGGGASYVSFDGPVLRPGDKAMIADTSGKGDYVIAVVEEASE